MATLALNLAVGIAGQILFSYLAPKPPDQEGPRLADLNIPAVSPGNPVNRVWGKMKVPAQLIWAPGLEETKHTKKVKGGKGGKKSQKQITYTYSASLAAAVGEGELTITAIFGNEKIIWSGDVDLDDFNASRDAYRAERLAHWTSYYTAQTFGENEDRTHSPETVTRLATNRTNQDVANWEKQNDPTRDWPAYDQLTRYSGSETQNPDPTMESYLGVGEVPAYRGTCYFVIDNLQLADFGNSIPQFRVEVKDRDGKVSMKDIVVDLCTEAGLVEGDTFEVAPDLTTMQIEGFTLSRLTSPREAIDMLVNVFPFNASEAGNSILFRGQDRLPLAAIDWNDLRAYGDGDSPGNKLERLRTDDLQLPREIKLSYQDVNRNFSKNTAVSSRQVSQSNSVQTSDLPVATEPCIMKKAAETAMATVISERNSYACTVPAKYLRLKAGDVVHLPVSATEYKVARIIQLDVGKNLLLEMKLSDHVMSRSDIVSIADDSVAGAQQVIPFADTAGYVMDVPSLDDTLQDTGVYVAFSPNTTNWSGGGLFRDTNSGSETPLFGQNLGTTSGTSWELEVSTTNDTHAGNAVSALPSASPYLVDRENKLEVVFTSPDPQFTGQTFEQAVSGTDNVFLVGDEIVQALSVEQVDDNFFIFSDLIRGLRGTEWAAHFHVEDERVVHLVNSALERWILPTTLLEKDVDYRVVSDGMDVLAQGTETLTFAAASDRAFAPAIIDVQRTITGDLTVSLDPRPRYNSGWLNGEGTATIDDDNYTVEIYDAPAYGAANLIRTTTLVGSRIFTYTATDQIADFGTAQSMINLKITQQGKDARSGFPNYSIV
jgi:hypothetical protein